MKFLLLLSLGVLGAATAFAQEEQPFFQINARCEGVDRAYVTAATGIAINRPQEMELQRVIARGGQYATLKLNWTPSVLPKEAKMAEIFQGITLEVKPVFSNGKITLYGKSVVRHPASRDDTGSFHAQTFTARETYFWGEGADDNPLTVRTGDSDKEPSWIVLTVKRIDEAEATRLTTPKFRVYAIEPTGEEARKHVYQEYDIVPKDPPEPGETDALKTVRKEGGYGMMIYSQPSNGVPYPIADNKMAKALRELSPDEQPIKVSGSISTRNSRLVDIKVESAEKYEPKFSTGETLRWGSDIYFALEDKTKPTGVRWLLIHQE